MKEAGTWQICGRITWVERKKLKVEVPKLVAKH
jgi:hypothetical protein